MDRHELFKRNKTIPMKPDTWLLQAGARRGIWRVLCIAVTFWRKAYNFHWVPIRCPPVFLLAPCPETDTTLIHVRNPHVKFQSDITNAGLGLWPAKRKGPSALQGRGKEADDGTKSVLPRRVRCRASSVVALGIPGDPWPGRAARARCSWSGRGLLRSCRFDSTERQSLRFFQKQSTFWPLVKIKHSEGLGWADFNL